MQADYAVTTTGHIAPVTVTVRPDAPGEQEAPLLITLPPSTVGEPAIAD